MKLTATDFTTSFPDDWQDRTIITLVAPFTPGGFAANCVITQHFVDATQNLEDFVGEQTRMMRESLSGFEVLDYRANEHYGLPSCQQLHRFSAENGLIQQVQTFVLANRKVFVITGTATVEDFGSHLAAFREIVENFSINTTE